MSRPAYVDATDDVNEFLKLAKVTPRMQDKYKKCLKTVKLLTEVGPTHPSLNTHRMQNLPGPDGRAIWNSYVESATANAWRMYWIWQDDGGITVISVGPHTHTPGTQLQLTRKGTMPDK
ncbi:hypothetical protein [Rhodococcus sp. SORGH_AS_0303]|uniref:hypothetical protein n=1 Tax=Rhodococcus sp. SORGH_AS_0303 TaxID=3041753 RepID=UPI00277D503B|nr:hypothetical protein [Rhodococcus sp. SORGH_AS_0303]MDQ1201095.1 hypothetical protein [Rhodococcus sp. SORGH_AS_0303]